GADIFAVRNDGETMLHIAAAVGNESIVELLISEGLNANIARRYGITPLHLAS
ncbi:MAG: ankryin, partial [Candidatus Aminicenantes bacterium]|nr:ankryin [Candidatus Aminicenantes bacterium]NIQ68749.1 ankryin [Candidatus Aminicenantes bacterium]NIT24781.1 ankryin [Candidatus Aminicenantes bacterium]